MKNDLEQLVSGRNTEPMAIYIPDAKKHTTDIITSLYNLRISGFSPRTPVLNAQQRLKDIKAIWQSSKQISRENFIFLSYAIHNNKFRTQCCEIIIDMTKKSQGPYEVQAFIEALIRSSRKHSSQIKMDYLDTILQLSFETDEDTRSLYFKDLLQLASAGKLYYQFKALWYLWYLWNLKNSIPDKEHDQLKDFTIEFFKKTVGSITTDSRRSFSSPIEDMYKTFLLMDNDTRKIILANQVKLRLSHLQHPKVNLHFLVNAALFKWMTIDEQNAYLEQLEEACDERFFGNFGPIKDCFIQIIQTCKNQDVIDIICGCLKSVEAANYSPALIACIDVYYEIFMEDREDENYILEALRKFAENDCSRTRSHSIKTLAKITPHLNKSLQDVYISLILKINAVDNNLEKSPFISNTDIVRAQIVAINDLFKLPTKQQPAMFDMLLKYCLDINVSIRQEAIAALANNIEHFSDEQLSLFSETVLAIANKKFKAKRTGGIYSIDEDKRQSVLALGKLLNCNKVNEDDAISTIMRYATHPSHKDQFTVIEALGLAGKDIHSNYRKHIWPVLECLSTDHRRNVCNSEVAANVMLACPLSAKDELSCISNFANISPSLDKNLEVLSKVALSGRCQSPQETQDTLISAIKAYRYRSVHNIDRFEIDRILNLGMSLGVLEPHDTGFNLRFSPTSEYLKL